MHMVGVKSRLLRCLHLACLAFVFHKLIALMLLLLRFLQGYALGFMVSKRAIIVDIYSELNCSQC